MVTQGNALSLNNRVFLVRNRRWRLMLRSFLHMPTLLLIGSLIGSPVLAQHSQAPDDKPRSVGSPYVELDSWIYPAIERLAALGYIHSEFLGMRPWTRIECARLVLEAGDMIDSSGSNRGQASELQIELKKEFRAELDALAGGNDRVIRLESVYVNLVGINGTPLNDSYHFGQTIINNYGRP
jgi:hypothetical protein